jgi:hypothetical protein
MVSTRPPPGVTVGSSSRVTGVSYVIALVFLVRGGGALEADFSLFVVNNLHLSLHVIGNFYFVNTTTIVLAQLVVVNMINQHSRTRVLAIVRTSDSSFE